MAEYGIAIAFTAAAMCRLLEITLYVAATSNSNRNTAKSSNVQTQVNTGKAVTSFLGGTPAFLYEKTLHQKTAEIIKAFSHNTPICLYIYQVLSMPFLPAS